MTPNFKFNLHIVGSFNYEKLVKSLINLGYEKSEEPIAWKKEGYDLVTDYDQESGKLGYFYSSKSRKTVNYNELGEECILALAAATEGEDYIDGEYTLVKPGGSENCVKSNKLYKCRKSGNSPYIYQNEKGNEDRIVSGWCRKPTFEEIINHFKGMNNKEIIGYKLKKDVPYVKAGTVLTLDKITAVWNCEYEVDGELSSISYTKAEVKNTEWFEPVYKENKDKVFNVPYNEGTLKVKVTPQGISEAENPDLVHFNNVVSYIQKLLSADYKIGAYNFEIETVNIGCKKGINFHELQKVWKYYESIKE